MIHDWRPVWHPDAYRDLAQVYWALCPSARECQDHLLCSKKLSAGQKPSHSLSSDQWSSPINSQTDLSRSCQRSSPDNFPSCFEMFRPWSSLQWRGDENNPCLLLCSQQAHNWNWVVIWLGECECGGQFLDSIIVIWKSSSAAGQLENKRAVMVVMIERSVIRPIGKVKQHWPAFVSQRVAHPSRTTLKNVCHLLSIFWNHSDIRILILNITKILHNPQKLHYSSAANSHLLTLDAGDTILSKLRHWVAIPLPTNPAVPWKVLDDVELSRWTLDCI